MDEKHIQYCIRLGNPFMREERYQEQFKDQAMSPSWIPETNLEDDNWTKINKKYTN